jgi:type IV fimbrial biogenesis protein FimT
MNHSGPSTIRSMNISMYQAPSEATTSHPFNLSISRHPRIALETLQNNPWTAFAMTPPKASKSTGFTLIELMVTIAILAIISSFAVPSFQRTIANGRISSATNELNTSLTLARGEAIRRGVRITVCKSIDGQTCDISSTTPWNSGWLIFDDITISDQFNAVVDVNDVIKQVVGPQGNDIVVRGNSGFPAFISFAPDGRPRAFNGAPQGGSFRVCSTSKSVDDASRSRLFSMQGFTGRLVIEKKSADPACTTAF